MSSFSNENSQLDNSDMLSQNNNQFQYIDPCPSKLPFSSISSFKSSGIQSQTYQEMVASFQKQLADANLIINNWQEQYNQLKNEKQRIVKYLTQQLDTLTHDKERMLNDCQNDFQVEQQRNNQLFNRCNEIDKEKESLRNQTVRLKEENKQLSEKNSEIFSQLSILQSQIEQNKTECDNQIHNNKNSYEQNLISHQTKIHQLNSEKEQIQNNYISLKQILQENQQNYSHLIQQSKQMQKESTENIKVISLQLEEKESELKTLQSSHLHLTSQHQLDQQLIENLQQQIHTSQYHLLDLSTIVQEKDLHEYELGQSQVTINQQKEEISKLKQNLTNTLEEINAQHSFEISNIQQKLLDSQKQHDMIIHDLEERLEKQTAQRVQAEKDVLRCRIILEKAGQSLEFLKNDELDLSDSVFTLNNNQNNHSFPLIHSISHVPNISVNKSSPSQLLQYKGFSNSIYTPTTLNNFSNHPSNKNDKVKLGESSPSKIPMLNIEASSNMYSYPLSTSPYSPITPPLYDTISTDSLSSHHSDFPINETPLVYNNTQNESITPLSNKEISNLVFDLEQKQEAHRQTLLSLQKEYENVEEKWQQEEQDRTWMEYGRAQLQTAPPETPFTAAPGIDLHHRKFGNNPNSLNTSTKRQ